MEILKNEVCALIFILALYIFLFAISLILSLGLRFAFNDNFALFRFADSITKFCALQIKEQFANVQFCPFHFHRVQALNVNIIHIVQNLPGGFHTSADSWAQHNWGPTRIGPTDN